MPTVKRFEDSVVWQLAEAQCEAYAQLASAGLFTAQNPLKDQMDRSSASVMDNIAEGFDRHSKTDFRHFLVMARGSNAEFRSQLYRAHKRKVITTQQLEQLKTASEHIGVKLHHFISYLTQTEFKQKPTAKDLSADAKLEEPILLYQSSTHNYPEEILTS